MPLKSLCFPIFVAPMLCVGSTANAPCSRNSFRIGALTHESLLNGELPHESQNCLEYLSSVIRKDSNKPPVESDGLPPVICSCRYISLCFRS